MLIQTKHIVIFIFIGVLVFSALIFVGDYEQINKDLLKVSGKTLSLLLLLSIGNYAVRFIKWSFFLNILNIRVNFVESALIFISGFSMALTPAKLGETVKSYLLRSAEKVSVKKSLPIVFAERLTDMIGLAVLSIAGIAVFFQAYLAVLLLTILIVVIALAKNEKLFYLSVKAASKIKFLKPRLENISLLSSSLKELLSVKSLTVSIPLSILSWGLEGLALYLLVNSLGFHMPLLLTVSIYSMPIIMGSLALLPGGLGVTEGGLLALLTFSGLPVSTASLSTIIIRITTLWFGIILGLVALLIMLKRLNRLQ